MDNKDLMRADKLMPFVTDPRGYTVLCSERQMEKIYAHHPELVNFWATEQDIELAISQAQFIYQSTHGKEFHVYYRSRVGKNTELKVIVKFNEDNVGTLWAAQPSSVGQRRPGETLLWPILKNP